MSIPTSSVRGTRDEGAFLHRGSQVFPLGFPHLSRVFVPPRAGCQMGVIHKARADLLGLETLKQDLHMPIQHVGSVQALIRAQAPLISA